MMSRLHSSSKRLTFGLSFSLALLILVGGILSGCASFGGRKPNGKWEVVERAGDILNRSAQSLPTQIGSEVEFAKKGNLLISSTETSLGALRYSFPDDTHLMIEDSTGHQEIIEYTLEDEVLTLSDGAISLMLKPYKELEATAANLAGAWTIPYDSSGEQEDSVSLGNMVGDVFGAVMGGEVDHQERCLVTDRRDASALSQASYSPTLIEFAADETFAMQDRFDAAWSGQFDVTGNRLTVTAEKLSPASAGDAFAQIRTDCRVVRLTNASLILGSYGNDLYLAYVRYTASTEAMTRETPTAVVDLLAPNISTLQGAWMLGGGGNGGIVLNADGTAEISGWGLGGSAMGMYQYPATYRVQDNMLSIVLQEDTGASIKDMSFTVVSLTKDTLVLSGEQSTAVFNSTAPLVFRRLY